MDPFDHRPMRKMLIPMWIAWVALLLATHVMDPPMIPPAHQDLEPGQEGGPGFSGPHFQPIANSNVPILPAPSTFSPTPALNPFNPATPGPLGQSSSAFLPQPPTNSLPLQILSVPSPTSALGLPPGSFLPPSPNVSLGVSGGVPQSVGPAPIATITYFTMGPSTLLNQFSQPPMVPFGQVGLQPQGYIPTLSAGGINVNPFNPTCNYYFFPNCGQGGGFSQNFRYSTR
ncbi:MAG: hypothetical protein ACYCTV_06335 [Leptospirales bacterium]